MAANASLTGLSRRHGVKVGAGSVLSVEEVALAVGQEIGHSSVKSAARMNRAVVLFLEKVEQANRLVETGLTVGGQFFQVTPLTQPAARITLSNGAPAVPDGKRRKRSECVRETEVIEERENVEVVVEVTGESGEVGKEMDLTGVVVDVLCGLGELGKTGEGMGEIRELGEAGETGDLGQTGDQCVAVGEVGQVTGERGAPGIVAGELGEGGMSTGERGEVGVSTGELGEGGAGTSEGSGGGRYLNGGLLPQSGEESRKMSGRTVETKKLDGWRMQPLPPNTSDHKYMSDGSELSNTVADSERDDLYPPSMIKSFLTQTKGMRFPDLGIYFPDKLLFIQSASHWIKHRAASDLTDPAHGQNEETAHMTVQTGAPACRLTGWEGMEPPLLLEPA
ncbi:hypothetical protein D4764_04G0004820 [Takifugu flavidus]|uniref:Uncharacterized protein n=1 Tax=Takifugu flavidus TaxID=433684 RepID=A0A5C6N3Y8_9TELE|nr:hypothetical protein D4764_04G0004820 [Takifugu flavidus]